MNEKGAQTLSHLNTVETIAADVVTKLDEKDREFIACNSLDDARAMHHSLGRWIRNTYGLWQDNLLTEKWRTDEASHKMIEGIDYSEDHPDNASDLIVQRVWSMLQDAGDE